MGCAGAGLPPGSGDTGREARIRSGEFKHQCYSDYLQADYVCRGRPRPRQIRDAQYETETCTRLTCTRLSKSDLYQSIRARGWIIKQTNGCAGDGCGAAPLSTGRVLPSTTRRSPFNIVTTIQSHELGAARQRTPSCLTYQKYVLNAEN